MKSALIVGGLLAFCAAPASAQWIQPELRFEVLPPAPAAGVNFRIGNYARLATVVGAETPFSGGWYTEVLARVTLDPFRQQRWGLSFGGGLRFEPRAYIAAVVDLEGPELGGWLPAVQAGLTGGVRAAIVARRAMSRSR